MDANHKDHFEDHHMWYKDVCKQDLKALAINIDTWETVCYGQQFQEKRCEVWFAAIREQTNAVGEEKKSSL
jgi:hypothetical protein